MKRIAGCLLLFLLCWGCGGGSTGVTEEKGSEGQGSSERRVTDAAEAPAPDASPQESPAIEATPESSNPPDPVTPDTNTPPDPATPDTNTPPDPGTPDASNPPEPSTPDTTPDTNTPPEPTPEPSTPDNSGQEQAPQPGKDYTKDGPMGSKDLPRVTFQANASTGCGTRLCTLYLDVTIPTQSGGPYPLAIVSNGFLLGDSQYASYAKRLASWGYVALRWDTNGESLLGSLSHKALGLIVTALIDWADTENKKSSSQLGGLVNTQKVFVVGHSRGGKINALAAQADKRIAGFFGIDPVNSSPRSGADYPSAVANMSSMQAPVAVVGAGKGAQGFQPCAPSADNYEKFYNAAKSPAWEILIPEAGHMQFLDRRTTCLTCLACTTGSTQDSVVRQITQAAMIAWAEYTIRGVDIRSSYQSTWLKTFTQANNLKVRNK